MQKVIVERPRWGSRLPNRGTARRIQLVEVVDDDFDSGPTRAKGMGREKWFNEHLNPLWRFLRSNLGRPWDRVYSEIRQRVDSRGTLGAHVLDHLDWEVATHCYLDGKQVMHGFARPVTGFYVHPKTGILLEAKRERRRRYNDRRYAIRWVVGPAEELYEKINELWYRVRYETQRDGRQALVDKRQCARKQIRRINDWIEAAERGKKGYERGADFVRALRCFLCGTMLLIGCYQPTVAPSFCSSSHSCRGAK